jgi:transposase
MDTTVAPLASIGVDIGKEVFHLVGFGTDGKIAFRRKVKRLALIETFKKLAPCVVGMEACSRRLPDRVVFTFRSAAGRGSRPPAMLRSRNAGTTLSKVAT